jgi:putative transposase
MARPWLRAVRKYAGEAAFIQRCQVHKKRNVVDHLPEEYKTDVKKNPQNAYAMADYADAKRALERLHRELMDVNPSAARSLEEGMEETLTVHKLRVPRIEEDLVDQLFNSSEQRWRECSYCSPISGRKASPSR